MENNKWEDQEAPWTGDGTEGNPYQVKTNQDLSNLYKYVKQNDFKGKFFRQEADIDLSGVKEETGSTWNPIGDVDHKFNGTYSGRGKDGILHKITNLQVVMQTGASLYCGLFGCLGENAVVQQLGIEEVELAVSIPTARVGAAAGVSYGTIRNCYVSIKTAEIKDASGIGGIAGVLEKGKITECFVTGDLCAEGSTEALGGIAGQNASEITSCYYKGALTGGGETYIGGIVGNFGDVGKDDPQARISYCYGLARIQGDPDHTGGISGENPPSGTSIEHCFYHKNYVRNGKDVGIGMELSEMLEDDFLSKLNREGEDTFYRPESKNDEKTEKIYAFTPALSVWKQDSGKGDFLKIVQESTSAIDWETIDIEVKEDSDEQAYFSWKIRNASVCVLQCKGQEKQEFSTEIEKQCVNVGADDEVKGILAIQNPYMKQDYSYEFSQPKPVFIESFTVKRRDTKIQKVTGCLPEGFLKMVDFADPEKTADYHVPNKSGPTPLPMNAYTCKWTVKRAAEKGVTISSGGKEYKNIDPNQKKYDYDSTSGCAVLTVLGKDGSTKTKEAHA